MRERVWTAGSLLQAAGNQCVRTGAGLLCLLLLLSLCAEPALAGKGKKYFREGRKAEQSNDFDTALVLYERAVREEPNQVQYLLAARRLRFLAAMTHVDRGHKLRDSGKLVEALKEFERAFAIDPSSAIAEQELRRTLSMLEAQEGAPPPGAAPPPAKSLTPREQAEAELQQRLERVEGPVTLVPLSRAPITLKATNESKVLFETVGKLAGINVLLEPDFQSRRISIELTRVTLEQALDHLAVITKNLWKPLTSNTILVYAAAKRREQEPLVIKTFYLSNLIQPQEIAELAQSIRNLLENNRVQQVNSQNAIIVRDTPDKVAIAEKLVNDIDKAKAEVVIDVAVLQMRRDRSREIGLFPGSPGLQIPVVFNPSRTLPGSDTGATSSAIPLSSLGSLSTNDWSIILPGAALNLLLSEGGARLLQNPQVRAVDGQSAKLAIGERIPIATGSFSSALGVGAGAGISPLVSTQFQYIDVGVNLDIIPKVHGDRDVSLKVKVEISAVTSRVNVGGLEQPIIGQRKVEEEIRLREGEMNILGGIIETQETTSMAGIPGLSKIPVLKHFFSSTRKEVSENEVLIVITPHIVRLPRMTAANLRGIDVGTSSNFRIRTRRATTEPAPAASDPTAVPAPPPPPLPSGPPGPAPPASPEQSSEKPESPPATPPDPAPAESPPDPGPGSATTPALPPRTDVVETPAVPAASATTALRFGEALYNQPVGSRFDVVVHIEHAQNVASLPLWLRYDPKLLKLVDVSHGNFLAPDGQLVTVAERVDHKTGMATVTLTREPGMQGVSGTGIVATLTFEAKTTGESRLNLLRTGARNPGQKTGQVNGARASVVVN